MTNVYTREDPPRAESMRRIEVECSVEHYGLPCGLATRQGPNVFEAYESDIPKILALVADPDKAVEWDGGPFEVRTDPRNIEVAQERFETKRQMFIEEKSAGRSQPVDFASVSLEYTGPRSMPHAYIDLFNKPLLPLRAVRVHEDVLPPRMSAEERRAFLNTQHQAEAIARALAAQQSQPQDNGSGPVVEHKRRR